MNKMEGIGFNGKGKSTGNKATDMNKNGQNMEKNKAKAKVLNEQDFQVWDNSRFAAIAELEDTENEEEKADYQENPNFNGPSCTKLRGRGKRPTIQISEAKVLSTEELQELAMQKQKEKRDKQKENKISKGEISRKSRQAAEDE